ncbi:hypothetical protein BKA70DRAFT_1285623, partial [Coprinopsis sp. MPI-PUGE-AT-0042]
MTMSAKPSEPVLKHKAILWIRLEPHPTTTTVIAVKRILPTFTFDIHIQGKIVTLTHKMSTPSTPHHTSQRVKLIRRALYGVLLGSILAFACSLSTYLGYLSFWLTPAMLGTTLIFTVTLLFTSAQNRAGTRPPAGKHHLPALCRKPTIVAAYAITIGWLAAFSVLVYFQVAFWKLEPSEQEWHLRGLGIAEAMLAVSNAAMFVLTGVLCGRERKEELGRPGREVVRMDAIGKR